MWIEFKNEKTVRGRKTGTVVARLEHGPFGLEGRGATKAEAQSSLLRKLSDAYERTQHGYVTAANGVTLVVRFSGEHWGYDILDPMSPRSYCASSCGGADTFDGMVALARQHAEQSYGGVAAVRTA